MIYTRSHAIRMRERERELAFKQHKAPIKNARDVIQNIVEQKKPFARARKKKKTNKQITHIIRSLARSRARMPTHRDTESVFIFFGLHFDCEKIHFHLDGLATR